MLEFLNGYSAPLIYVFLFILLLLCGLGFPMAEELVLLAGGVLVASGVLHPFLMLLVNFLGVLIGDVFLFGLGRGVNSHFRRCCAHEVLNVFRNSSAVDLSLHAMGTRRSFWLVFSRVYGRQRFSSPGRCRCRCGVLWLLTRWRA